MYFVIFAGITLMVSAIATSSRQALVLLLAFWFTNCLLFPQVVADIGARVYPAIDGFELPAAVANAKGNLPPEDKLLPEVTKRLLAQYKVQKVEDLPIDPIRVVRIELDAEGDKIQEKIFNDMHDAYEKQDGVYQIGSIIAPMMAVQSFSMAVCETHFAHYRRFSDTAEVYRQNLVHLMDQADLSSEDAKPNSHRLIVQNRATWAKVPPFEYSSPPLPWSLRRSSISILMLLFWFIAVVLLTPLTILRLRID
jgi:ABC-2 type transport system permease protein